ncbi:hypothetical protein QBC37DRAFT_404330 [Rhypophila decipiens]|uniref:Uncharacterized protein n=1 Tax=Rhypophila decipiens TaxID=261697 RepID=A0AAN6XZ80_9PEZI|nr:hypothetical protein QBC37DRAFT_404330 [Rhypophila decipiens]
MASRTSALIETLDYLGSPCYRSPYSGSPYSGSFCFESCFGSLSFGSLSTPVTVNPEDETDSEADDEIDTPYVIVNFETEMFLEDVYDMCDVPATAAPSPDASSAGPTSPRLGAGALDGTSISQSGPQNAPLPGPATVIQAQNPPLPAPATVTQGQQPSLPPYLVGNWRQPRPSQARNPMPYSMPHHYNAVVPPHPVPPAPHHVAHQNVPIRGRPLYPPPVFSDMSYRESWNAPARPTTHPTHAHGPKYTPQQIEAFIAHQRDVHQRDAQAQVEAFHARIQQSQGVTQMPGGQGGRPPQQPMQQNPCSAVPFGFVMPHAAPAA